MSNLECYINDRFYSLKIDAGWTTLHLLREVIGLTGTKESCSEGDCGACTVAVGRWENDQFIYRSINSCIYPAAKLHGAHLISIEGLSIDREMHPIQEILFDCKGTQCGFCTPGIVMSLFSLYTQGPSHSKDETFAFLEGNLCRCTGYLSIIEAGQHIEEYYQKNPDTYQYYLPAYCHEIIKKLKNSPSQKMVYTSSLSIEKEETHTYIQAKSMNDLAEAFKKYPSAKIICGGTDLMVEANIRRILHPILLDISEIPELKSIELKDQHIIIGAGVTYDELYHNELIKNEIPAFQNIIPLIASQQVRNNGSIGGNIANASPVGDLACALLGMDAKLMIYRDHEFYKVHLKDFYIDYKKTILNSNEIIFAIILPRDNQLIHFEKSTKRKAVDISAVVSLFSLKKDQSARLSFGGISACPRVIEISKEEMEEIISHEDSLNIFIDKTQERFQPLSDVRGSEKYRRLLIANHILSHIEAIKGRNNE